MGGNTLLVLPFSLRDVVLWLWGEMVCLELENWGFVVNVHWDVVVFLLLARGHRDASLIEVAHEVSYS